MWLYCQNRYFTSAFPVAQRFCWQLYEKVYFSLCLKALRIFLLPDGSINPPENLFCARWGNAWVFLVWSLRKVSVTFFLCFFQRLSSRKKSVLLLWWQDHTPLRLLPSCGSRQSTDDNTSTWIACKQLSFLKICEQIMEMRLLRTKDDKHP